MTFRADYFDGISARTKSVLVTLDASAKGIMFDVDGETLRFAISDLDIQARLGASKRLIDLPNGGRLEAPNIGALEALTSSKTNVFWAVLHYLENHLVWVLVFLGLTVFSGWFFLQFGVPKLAEYVAKATPPAIEYKLGEQVLKGLDSRAGYFLPSKTAPKRKQSISSALNKLCQTLQDCPQYRLEFRAGGVIGANAFALPGGIMAVTDEMVALSKNDTEIIAVLAHELGHVRQRHAFRQSLQGVLAGLILAAVTGDVSGIGSGLPAALMQMRYSRQHEFEADAFALKAMQKACLPTKAFADILQRLSFDAAPSAKKVLQDKPAKKPPTEPKKIVLTEWLSTHPDTQSRIQPFLTARQDCD